MEDSNNTPIIAGALAAGLATAAIARKPKITNELQQAIKDKGLLIGLSYPASKKRKLLAKLLYSWDLNFKNINTGKNEYIDKPIFYKNILDRNRTYSKHTVNSQVTADAILKNISDKSSLSDTEFIGDLFPKTKKLSDVLKEMSIDKNSFNSMSKDQIDDVFRSIESTHGQQFLKPISGQSMGKGTDNIYARLGLATTKKKVKPGGFEKIYMKEKYIDNPNAIDELKTNYDNYILTEYLGNNPETRLHTLNGEVIDSVKRFGFFEGAPTKFFKDTAEKAQFEDSLRKLYKARGIDKENVSLAFDATRDATGKVRLIEANPNSGFLFNLTDVTTKTPYIRPWEYASTHKIYKKLTGRDTTTVAALKGLAAGGAVVGGAAAYDKVMEKKAEDRGVSTERKLLAGGLLTAALTTAAYPIIKNRASIYHVLPSNHYINNRSNWVNKLLFGDRKFTTITDLKNIKLKDNDKVYFDVPGRLLDGENFTGPQMINNNKKIYDFFDNKHNLNSLTNVKDNIPKLEELSNYSGNLTSDIKFADFIQAVKNQRGSDYEFIIKPKDGYAGEGIVSSLSRDKGSRMVGMRKFFDKRELIDSLNKDSYIVNFNKAKQSPDKYVIQEYIDTPNEYRVGILNDKVISHGPRHTLTRGLTIEESDNLEVLAKNLHRDLKDRNLSDNTYLGLDVGFVNNKPYIYDINTNEGFTQVPFERKFFKGLTGNTPMNYKLPATVAGAAAVSAMAQTNKDKLEKNAQLSTLPIDFLTGADPTGIASKKRAIATDDYATTRRIAGDLGAFGLGAAVSTALTAGAFKVSAKFLKKSPALFDLFDTAAKDTLLVFRPKKAKDVLKKLNEAHEDTAKTVNIVSSLDKDLATINNSRAMQAEDLKVLNSRIKNKEYNEIIADEAMLEKIKSKENEEMLDTFINIKNKAKQLQKSRTAFADKHGDSSINVLRKGGAVATGLASGVLGGVLNSASADSQFTAGKEIQKLKRKA